MQARLPTSLAAGAVALAILTAGCGSSGRELAEVAPGQTAPPRSTSTSATVATVPLVLSLTTGEWSPGGPLPVAVTCDGEGRSPSLTWTGVPTGTAELALVVRDPDAGDFLHWMVTGIAPTDGTIAAGELPVGATVQPGDGGDAAWEPPCPPEGEQHAYSFELFALPAPAELPAGDAAATLTALERQASHRSALTGTHAR